MLWDYLRTLIMVRLTLQSPCMCAGCQRGRRASQSAFSEEKPRRGRPWAGRGRNKEG
jgi:hypothetical protein